MSFKDIWIALYNKLLEIKNTDLRLAEVYNRDIKIEWWLEYPLITITPTNGSEVELDSCLNDMSVNFTIRTVDQIQDWYADVEDNIRELADIVLEKLKDLGDITYSNGATYRLTFDYLWWRIDVTEPTRVFEVTCRFQATETK